VRHIPLGKDRREERTMNDGPAWTRESRLIAAACWLATGVIGLIANFHLISPQWFEQSWKLWPLIPIAIGVGAFLNADRYRPSHD
jgi:hypothetical protein